MESLAPASLSRLVHITLGHVRREYPHSETLRIESAADLAAPSVHHPVFYGSYDWHSCVHGYWLLAQALQQNPDSPDAELIAALFDEQLTAEKVAQEIAYFQAPGRGGFERPYGWAWLLALSTTLGLVKHPGALVWAGYLDPLADLIVERFMLYLPKLSHPVRSGAHANTAFALYLALEYAEARNLDDLRSLIAERSVAFYLEDLDCQAWEPGGEDFLSPAWQEALLMQRVMGADSFRVWFEDFLPALGSGLPESLLKPVEARDRSDGRLAHLDGLNLSRAWCMRLISTGLQTGDPRREVLLSAAQRHLQAGSAHLQDDYMGEHWLATFLLLALNAQQR